MPLTSLVRWAWQALVSRHLWRDGELNLWRVKKKQKNAGFFLYLPMVAVKWLDNINVDYIILYTNMYNINIPQPNVSWM